MERAVVAAAVGAVGNAPAFSKRLWESRSDFQGAACRTVGRRLRLPQAVRSSVRRGSFHSRRLGPAADFEVSSPQAHDSSRVRRAALKILHPGEGESQGEALSQYRGRYEAPPSRLGLPPGELIRNLVAGRTPDGQFLAASRPASKFTSSRTRAWKIRSRRAIFATAACVACLLRSSTMRRRGSARRELPSRKAAR